jgi:hypothetical protein
MIYLMDEYYYFISNGKNLETGQMEIFNSENGEGNAKQIVGDPMAFVQMRDSNPRAAENCN